MTKALAGGARRAAAMALALTLGGCASDRHRVSTTLGPGGQAVLTVQGDHPLVSVRNNGPGTLHLTMPNEAGLDLEDVLVRGSISRTMPAEGDIRLRAGDQPAAIEIEARRASGITFDMQAGAGPS